MTAVSLKMVGLLTQSDQRRFAPVRVFGDRWCPGDCLWRSSPCLDRNENVGDLAYF